MSVTDTMSPSFDGVADQMMQYIPEDRKYFEIKKVECYTAATGRGTCSRNDGDVLLSPEQAQIRYRALIERILETPLCRKK